MDIENIQIYLPGDIITEEPGLMRQDIRLQYFKAGKILIRRMVLQDRVLLVLQQKLISKEFNYDKSKRLITVTPLRSAYNPQIGDIIVGRVYEIQDKRWCVDINSSSSSSLHLNSTFIPQQRFKTEEDELNMRNLFSENDLICAEIHSINNDHTVNLHTRNIKYGKLSNGLLVTVNHTLIRRQKHHFVRLKCGIDIIFSHNGMLWLNNQDRSIREQKQDLSQSLLYTIQQRLDIAKITNILRLLSKQGNDISVELLDEIYEMSNKLKLHSIDLLDDRRIQPILVFLNQRSEDKWKNKLQSLQKNVNLLQELS